MTPNDIHDNQTASLPLPLDVPSPEIFQLQGTSPPALTVTAGALLLDSAGSPSPDHRYRLTLRARHGQDPSTFFYPSLRLWLSVVMSVSVCPCVIVLSHWPHVATHVATQVAAHVASVKGLGHKSLNLLPSPFTLATCAATSLRAAATSGEWN